MVSEISGKACKNPWESLETRVHRDDPHIKTCMPMKRLCVQYHGAQLNGGPRLIPKKSENVPIVTSTHPAKPLLGPHRLYANKTYTELAARPVGCECVPLALYSSDVRKITEKHP